MCQGYQSDGPTAEEVRSRVPAPVFIRIQVLMSSIVVFPTLIALAIANTVLAIARAIKIVTIGNGLTTVMLLRNSIATTEE